MTAKSTRYEKIFLQTLCLVYLVHVQRSLISAEEIMISGYSIINEMQACSEDQNLRSSHAKFLSSLTSRNV